MTAGSRRFDFLTGDEPHYLLIAHSLAFDYDINLKNNLTQEDYRNFYHKPVSGYTKNGRFWSNYVKGHLRYAPTIYWENRGISTCPVGMPILIAPTYRLGHLMGGRIRYLVVVFFHIIAAACAVIMADILFAVTLKWPVALGVTIGFMFAGPLLFYTVPIFPDMPAALTILLITWLTMRAIECHGVRCCLSLAVVGLLIGYLPWLHSRFWLHSAILLVYVLMRILQFDRKNRIRAIIFVGAPFGIAAALLARYYLDKYGVPWPVSTHPEFSLTVGMTSGGPGLWLDRDNGLLFYCPIAVAFFPGSVLAWRKRQIEVRLAVVLVLANWLLIGFFSDWRGGLCPPMRYWVPVMPMLAIPAGLYLSRLRGLLSKVLFVLLGTAGIGIGLTAMKNAASLYRYTHPVFYRWHSLWYHDMPNVYFPSSDWLATLFAVAALLSLLLFLRTQGYGGRLSAGPTDSAS